MKTFNNFGFKNAVIFLVLMFALVSSSISQQPQYYNYQGVGSSSNIFPFSVTAGKEVQWLFLAGDFNQPSGAPSGNITTIYIYMTGAASNTLTSLTVKMGLSAITSLPTGAIYTGQLDTVYYRASVTLNSVLNGWMSITLDRPFAYNNTQSLILDISQCAATSTVMTLRQNTLTGVRRTYINAASCVFTYGGQDANALNFGLDIAPPTTVCTHTYAHQLSNATVLFQAVCAVSPYIGWVAGATATVRKTIDGGATWTNANPNTGVITGDIYNVTAVDANNAWVTTSAAATFIYRTTNGGTNWTQVFTQTGGFIDGMVFTTVNNGFAYGDPVGGRWSLFRTTNGGTTWDSTGLYVPQAGSEAGWNNSINVKGSNIWYGTNNTKVYHTTNAGVNWTSGVTTFLDSYCMHFNDINNGLAGGETLNRTTNGGVTYTLLAAPGAGNITGMAGANSTYYWFTRGDSLYATTNSGTNWSIAFGDTKGLWAADVATLNNGCGIGWAVGDSGKIIRINVDSLVGIQPLGNGVPYVYRLAQNYPNPFNPSTKIAFDIPKAGIVNMVVYDLLGREVATLVNEFKQAGKYDVDFNALNLASGVYFYKITAGEFVDTKKMLLIK